VAAAGRDGKGDGGSLAWCAPDGDPAAEAVRHLLHAAQANCLPVGLQGPVRMEALPVVADEEPDRAVADGQAEGDGGRGGVGQDVVQRLLGHPVDNDRGRGVETAAVQAEMERYVQARFFGRLGVEIFQDLREAHSLKVGRMQVAGAFLEDRDMAVEEREAVGESPESRAGPAGPDVGRDSGKLPPQQDRQGTGLVVEEVGEVPALLLSDTDQPLGEIFQVLRVGAELAALFPQELLRPAAQVGGIIVPCLFFSHPALPRGFRQSGLRPSGRNPGKPAELFQRVPSRRD